MSLRKLEVAVAEPGKPASPAAARAAAAGAHLLVLQRPAQAAAEASDGALAHAMGDLAAEHGLAILFSYAEACSGLTHLALQLVLADGRSTANYRATHLAPGAVEGGWAPGNWLTMARLEPVTLGLMAGLDHLAPEVGRALSGLGAETLIAVTDDAIGPDAAAAADLLEPLVRLRAIENGVPILLAGPAGLAYAAAPDGALLPVIEAEGVRLCTLTIDDKIRAAPRRPDLYHQLVMAERD
jgi:predicted amidohydrolase